MAKKPQLFKHLTASMRVMRAHFARPGFTIADAHHAIKELALRLGTGEATPDDLVLEEKLKKSTRLSVAELAHFAEDWPTA